MLFKRRQDDDLEVTIDRLHVEALQCEIPGEAASRYNRAGDLLLAAGDFGAAVESYGRAVDSLIQADRAEAGIAQCRKIIRRVPQVIRARCTLTWLVIGAGYPGEVARCAADYVTSAEYAGCDDVARAQLRRMTAVARHPAIRSALAECLLLLGDARGADQVLGGVYRDLNAGPTPDPRPAEIWEAIRDAALLAPNRAGQIG